MLNEDRVTAIAIVSLCLFVVLFLSQINAVAQENIIFQEVEIEEPFRDVLLQHPEFMLERGARIFADDDRGSALIGIGKVVPENDQVETMLQARRIGEILARTAILELRDGIKISTSRGLKEGISLSTFFQVTETRVEGKIQQLPVIGTWWSPNHRTFCVAVGTMIDATTHQIMLKQSSPSLAASRSESLRLGEETVEVGGNKNYFMDMEGEEPFLSLLRISLVLCQNGGVRGFLLDKNNKVLIAVASASLKGLWTKTRRIAQLKAIRSVLGHRQGIQLSSVEYLGDQEQMSLTVCLHLAQSTDFFFVKSQRTQDLVVMDTLWGF